MGQMCRGMQSRRASELGPDGPVKRGDVLQFASAVFFLIITPGPGVLSTAGTGAGFGYRAGRRYVAGLWLGNLLVSLMVISGLAALAFSVPLLREVLVIASLGYLLYLAAKIAFAGAKVGFVEASEAPSFWNGVTLQFINPKAYVVSTALFGSFSFMPENLVAETLIKLLIFNVIWVPLHFLWLWAGVTIRRMELPDRRQRAINMAMAASMLMVVAISFLAGRG
ncbi:MAG: LysE family translocator [Pseudomonadota bacterium]